MDIFDFIFKPSEDDILESIKGVHLAIRYDNALSPDDKVDLLDSLSILTKGYVRVAYPDLYKIFDSMLEG